MDNLTSLIKRASMEAEEAGKPTVITYGKVLGVRPLRVKVSDKLILPAEVLVVPEHLTDHEIKLEAAPGTEIKYKVKAALKEGDKVVMLRNRGGQLYLILDRTVS